MAEMGPDELHAGKYADLMPDMDDDEYEALKRSIEQEGLRHPIEVTPDGMIIDGHHRYRACQELGIEPDITIVEDATPERAIRANFTRRNLNDGTKRDVVEQYLRDRWNGDRALSEVAEALGVSIGTVSNAKQEVEKDSTTEILSTDEKRQKVSDYLDRNPDASNREVARTVTVDVSHATVGNWREEWESPPEDDGVGEQQNATRDDTVANEEPETADPPGTPTYDDDLDPADPTDVVEKGKSPDTGSDADSNGADEAQPSKDSEQAESAIQANSLTTDADSIADYQERIDELEAELAAKEDRISELEGAVEERDALLRDLSRAVENQDPEAIQSVADRAEGLR